MKMKVIVLKPNTEGTHMTDLERLIAIEDIRALQSRYVRYADLKDWQALAGLFLPMAPSPLTIWRANRRS